MVNRVQNLLPAVTLTLDNGTVVNHPANNVNQGLGNGIADVDTDVDANPARGILRIGHNGQTYTRVGGWVVANNVALTLTNNPNTVNLYLRTPQNSEVVYQPPAPNPPAQH